MLILNAVIEKFLSTITALHQLEPKNLPNDVIEAMVKMSPEELFKTCSQLATLLNNIPTKTTPITLTQTEIASLAENYLKEIVRRLKP